MKSASATHYRTNSEMLIPKAREDQIDLYARIELAKTAKPDLRSLAQAEFQNEQQKRLLTVLHASEMTEALKLIADAGRTHEINNPTPVNRDPDTQSTQASPDFFDRQFASGLI